MDHFSLCEIKHNFTFFTMKLKLKNDKDLIIHMMHLKGCCLCWNGIHYRMPGLRCFMRCQISRADPMQGFSSCLTFCFLSLLPALSTLKIIYGNIKLINVDSDWGNHFTTKTCNSRIMPMKLICLSIYLIIPEHFSNSQVEQRQHTGRVRLCLTGSIMCFRLQNNIWCCLCYCQNTLSIQIKEIGSGSFYCNAS